MSKQTAGKIYLDLKSKKQDKVSVFEMTEAQGDDIMRSLVEHVEKDKKRSDGDFFVELCFFMDPIMYGVTRAKMISRKTCPTPFPDRAAFHYIHKDEQLKFLWHVPSLQEIDYYREFALTVRDDEKEARNDAFSYLDGSLLKRAKKFNGEINDFELTFYRKDSDGRPITS